MAAVGSLIRAALTAGALASGAGCVTMPSERAEAPPLPSAWRDAPLGAEQPVTDWWQGFNDPALNQLVVEALSEGPNVQLAVSRVREARALSTRPLLNSCRNSPRLAAASISASSKARRRLEPIASR